MPYPGRLFLSACRSPSIPCLPNSILLTAVLHQPGFAILLSYLITSSTPRSLLPSSQISSLSIILLLLSLFEGFLVRQPEFGFRQTVLGSGLAYGCGTTDLHEHHRYRMLTENSTRETTT